jgi:hypothetical protein
MSPSGAAKVPEICNVESSKLQRHEDMDPATPKVLSGTNLNDQLKSPKLATNMCDVKHTILKRHNEKGNTKTASQFLDAATAEDYSEKTESSSEPPTTAANINIEEHFTERHEEASNTAPCSTVSTKNDTDQPGTDLNRIDENCFKHPVTNAEGIEDGAEVENTERNAAHPSTSMTKESLPKQDEINQSEGYLYKLKDIFCKSPTIAMEAPNILKDAGENPLSNENIPDTASHGYLLDDDIGLTGSQLLRIEHECQHKIQSTDGVWNHASICGKAIVPDTAVSAPTLPPPNWAQIVQEKRQKLRSVIRDISRLK